LYAMFALHVPDAGAQVVIQYAPSTAACVELNQQVVTQVANGPVAAAEAALARALASGDERFEASCGPLVFSNMAAVLAVTGRIAEAERLAERSVKALETIYPRDDPSLLRPLQILAATRFEQGKTAKSREAFRRMQLIRLQRPEDRALVHGMAASLLHGEGRRKEAETEYLAALRAWGDAGRGEFADAGAILNCLGSLYIDENRLDDARRVLDHALIIFRDAVDATTMDRIKLMHVRGVLHARQDNWREAVQDFSDALTMIDRESGPDPLVVRSVLQGYAIALRKNHRPREARVVEARVALLGRDNTHDVVDLTDLLPKPKRRLGG
jgi:tetratricopeptide (TPR) repeat protein